MTASKVLVTGSSSGIGRSLTEQLLAAGATVVGVARDHGKFTPGSDRYLPVSLDLADLDAAGPALDRLAREHTDCGAVVSNAGHGRIAEIEQLSARQIRGDIDLNLTSHLLLARAFLPAMKRRGRGDLLFTGSTAGRRGARKGSVYCATKFGLRGLAQALRQECAGSGVRVTLIAPGAVDTPFFDRLEYRPADATQHALRPEDVARVMLFVIESPAGVLFDEIVLGAPHDSMRRA